MKISTLSLCLIFLIPLLSFSQNVTMECGFTAMTCKGASNSDYVLTVHDVRALTNTTPDGTNSTPPVFHGSDWTVGRMGQVFGLAIDNAGNIFTTATTSYNSNQFGSAGQGGIYKINGSTGVVTDFASLPNAGSGLGNICHHPDLDLLYVTNFHDGKIYRLAMTGSTLSTFDHNGPSSQSSPPFINLGHRPWGIGYYENRIYYGLWNEDMSRPNASIFNEVWSVAIDATGEFIPSSVQCEVKLPTFTNGWSSPPSDISFSESGRMLIAERTMNGDAKALAHNSRILEYSGIAPLNSCNPIWGTAKEIFIGDVGLSENSAGGIDYGYGAYDVASGDLTECDDIIWGSGDALIFEFSSSFYSYGIAGVPASGNSNVFSDPTFVETTSYHIDADGVLSQQDKTDIGDVELYYCGGCDDGGGDPTDPGGPCDGQVDTKTFSTIINANSPNNRHLDHGYSGIQDSDSGNYLICGETNSFNRKDVYVNDLDIGGNLTFSTICDWNQQSELAHWMNESKYNSRLPSGGYIYTGSVNDQSTRNMFIKITDKSGSVVHSTVFETQDEGDEIGYSVMEDRNGEFVAVGKRTGANGLVSAFAAGLDNAFNVKWIKEYHINGFAWSVVEIPSINNDNQQNAYALTGVSDNKVFVMVISATTGNPIGQFDIISFDLDGNLQTEDVGHSINVDLNGDLILTGSANNINVSPTPGSNRIFIMRIPIGNILQNPTVQNLVDFANILDIPSSPNELGRHIVANSENDYIISGRAFVTEDRDLLQDAHGFILKVENNGNQIEWINEYIDPNYIGSNLERVEQAQDGGYYSTGSIWNVGALDFEYKQLAIKTDSYGNLSDCNCTKALEIELFATPLLDKHLQSIAVNNHQEFESPLFVIDQILSDQLFCDQYCPDDPQDDCDITSTHTIDTVSDTCCIVNLDLLNGMTGVHGVQIDIIGGGVVFDNATVNLMTPFFIASNSPTHIKLNSTTGEIPPGVYDDFISYCYGIDSGSSSSQIIMISYYDEFCNVIKDCRDIIHTNCEVEPTNDECFEIVDIDIECDPTMEGLYKLTFSIDNQSGQTLGDLTFFPVGTGVTVIPSTVSITPPVIPGDLSSPQCMSVFTSGPFPQNIQFTYSMIDTAGLFCCSVMDTLDVLLPNCCEPCINPDVFSFLNTTSTDIDSCCHTIDIDNRCDQLLTKVQVELLTPGVTFNSANIGGSLTSFWSLNPISTTTVDYVPDMIPAPAGYYDQLVNICLDNAVGAFPQEVALHYYISDGLGGEEILCTDYYIFECEPEEEEECIDITQYDVYCDPATGKYFLDFCIENISNPPFTATEIALYVPPPYDLSFAVSPNLFSGLTFASGDVFCGTTEITGIVAPMAGDVLDIEFEMHYNVPGQTYVCCTIRKSITIELPSCGCEDSQDPYCCESLDVESVKIQHQDCCYTNILTNNNGPGVVQLVATILTPNRVFGSVSSIGGFNPVVSGGGLVVSTTHSSGTIPSGTNPAYDFCIINTSSYPHWSFTTVIEYQWIKIIGNQQVVICTEKIKYKCKKDRIPIDPTVCVDDIVVNPSPRDQDCFPGATTSSTVIQIDVPIGIGMTEIAIDVDPAENSIVDYFICGPSGLFSEIGSDDNHIYLEIVNEATQQGSSLILLLQLEQLSQSGFDLTINQISGDLRCEIIKRVTGCQNVGMLSDDVDSGIYHYTDRLESDASVQAESVVVFKAGNEINLIGGFQVDLNAVFETKIEQCLIIENR